jgi:hypothetical protein
MVTQVSSDLPALPRTGRKFLVYLLAFTVTLGAGVGPLLGVIRVPGFIAIGELFPLNLQRAVAAQNSSRQCLAISSFSTSTAFSICASRPLRKSSGVLST